MGQINRNSGDEFTALENALEQAEARAAQLQSERDEARDELEMWKGGYLYPSTYRAAVEEVVRLKAERATAQEALTIMSMERDEARRELRELRLSIIEGATS
jgi:hypothetical protein